MGDIVNMRDGFKEKEDNNYRIYQAVKPGRK